jgi:E3 ubiquitin-protein ligase MARCH6
MFVVNSALVSVPIVLGRFIFAQLSFPLTNDLYTFCAGFYAVYGAASLAHSTFTFMTSLPVPQIISEICLYAIMGLKLGIITLFLGLIVPLLIGLVFELVFAIPWRVATDQSPHFFIYQDWGLGLIYLKVWYRVVVARAEHLHQNQPVGVLQDGFDLHAVAWKAKIDQIYQDGFRNLHLVRMFTTVIFPILDRVLILLCVPYIFAKGFIPLAGGSLHLSSVAYRYGYPIFAIMITLVKLQRPLLLSLRSLHNAIRDDKYLVGRRLHNYTTAMR